MRIAAAAEFGDVAVLTVCRPQRAIVLVQDKG